MSYLYEQAGTMKDLSDTGLWLIDELSPKDLNKVLDQNPDIKKDWDPFYGDRMIKLVFIGQNLDKEQIKKELDECLD